MFAMCFVAIEITKEAHVQDGCRLVTSDGDIVGVGQAKRQAPFLRLVIKIDCYQGCSSMDWIKFLRRLGRSGPGNNNLCFSVIDFDYNTAKEMPPNSFSILVAF